MLHGPNLESFDLTPHSKRLRHHIVKAPSACDVHCQVHVRFFEH
jgi:hypothetical protein